MSPPTSVPAAELITERSGEVLRLVLNRPSRLNALSTPLVDALHGAFDIAERDRPRALLIVGNGRSFSAGFDLRQDIGTDGELAQLARMQELTARLRALPLPSVCGVHGDAVGGGLELALACDVLVSTPDARLSFPDVRAGFAVGGGATYLLPRLIGLARTRHLLLTGGELSGSEACAAGMVAALAAPDDLRAEVLGIAERIAELAPDAVRRIRAGIDAGTTGTLDETLRRELDDMAATMHADAGASTLHHFREHGSYQRS